MIYTVKKKDGGNCLHIAASKGCLGLGKILIRNFNFDIDSKDCNDFTALHYAVSSGNLEFVQFLIGIGSRLDSKTVSWMNCLHIAGSKGHFHLCKLLIEIYNFNIHMTDDNGKNVLLFAAGSGDLELCQYLIERGIDINSTTIDNMNCLGHFRFCKALLEALNFDIHMQNDEGFSALHYAAKDGNLEMFKYFLEKGSNIYDKTKDNRDCLHIAAKSGCSVFCEALLTFYGFKTDTRCSKGWTAIHYAIESGNIDLIKYFVKKGSDIYWKTKNNSTCLHIAASRGHVNVCKTLLEEYNFDISLTNISGWNVLHYAARSGDLELFQFFKQKEIDINSKTKRNSNCLHIATVNGHFNLCKTLVEVYNFDVLTRNVMDWSVLHYAAKSGNLDLFQYFIQLGADVYSKTNRSLTCLHIASHRGHINICRKIFDLYHSYTKNERSEKSWNLGKCSRYEERFRDKNYFLNLRDINGCTYLHYAAYGGYTSICKLLVTYNVDVTYRNIKGKTARDIAIESKFQNVLDVLKKKYDPVGK